MPWRTSYHYNTTAVHSAIFHSRISGLYYRELGKAAAKRADAKAGEAEFCFREAAHLYRQAAEVYPEDDENYICELASSPHLLPWN